MNARVLEWNEQRVPITEVKLDRGMRNRIRKNVETIAERRIWRDHALEDAKLGVPRRFFRRINPKTGDIKGMQTEKKPLSETDAQVMRERESFEKEWRQGYEKFLRKSRATHSDELFLSYYLRVLAEHNTALSEFAAKFKQHEAAVSLKGVKGAYGEWLRNAVARLSPSPYTRIVTGTRYSVPSRTLLAPMPKDSPAVRAMKILDAQRHAVAEGGAVTVGRPAPEAQSLLENVASLFKSWGVALPQKRRIL